MNKNFIKNVIGYAVLIGFFFGLLAIYYQKQNLIGLNFFNIVVLAASSAIIVVTVSIFWLWKEDRVEYLENLFGPLGHVPHCGYCFSLWIGAFYTSVFGISLISSITTNRGIDFLISWWGMSFFNVLFYEIFSVLWFKKLQMEFSVRELYNKKSK